MRLLVALLFTLCVVVFANNVGNQQADQQSGTHQMNKRNAGMNTQTSVDGKGQHASGQSGTHQMNKREAGMNAQTFDGQDQPSGHGQHASQANGKQTNKREAGMNAQTFDGQAQQAAGHGQHASQANEKQMNKREAGMKTQGSVDGNPNNQQQASQSGVGR